MVRNKSLSNNILHQVQIFRNKLYWLHSSKIPIILARTVYGDHERYRQTYFTTFNGYYFSGDGALRDDHGFYQITGRVDDVINVTGHRLGTAEVEDVLVKL